MLTSPLSSGHRRAAATATAVLFSTVALWAMPATAGANSGPYRIHNAANGECLDYTPSTLYLGLSPCTGPGGHNERWTLVNNPNGTLLLENADVANACVARDSNLAGGVGVTGGCQPASGADQWQFESANSGQILVNSGTGWCLEESGGGLFLSALCEPGDDSQQWSLLSS